MVNAWNPWSLRGGRAENGAAAGAFSFNNDNGNANINNSFRVVLLDYKRKRIFVESIPIFFKKGISKK